jgi:hypothetical protein
MMANPSGGVVRDVSMPRDRGTAAVDWVFPDRVLAAFADEATAVCTEMAGQLPPPHDAAEPATSWTRLDPVSSR